MIVLLLILNRLLTLLIDFGIYSNLNKLRTAMQKSNIRGETDMLMIRIQALEWVQGRVQDLILNSVTRDWPVYDDE
jgi:hypothetical protein